MVIFKIDFFFIKLKMNTKIMLKNMKKNGYWISENILNQNEIFKAKELVYDWYDDIDKFD